jgi:hypothetical protein
LFLAPVVGGKVGRRTEAIGGMIKKDRTDEGRKERERSKK